MTNILIVDDEKSIRKTFEAFLVNDGYNVFTAENVEIALEIISKTELDLILTDIIMPRISGMKLLKIMDERVSDIPIIIMTGEPTIESAVSAVKSSAYDYITKPVSKYMLLKTVKNALKYKALETQNKEYKENLEKVIEERTTALQQAMNATILTITAAMRLRDPYTAGHERKVGNLAVEIGKKMNLTVNQIDCICVAGYLHDIGKISVPAEILARPGSLIDLEFDIIKMHAIYGFDILREANLPWPVADVVYQHHERIDGSGYPNGLKDDEIMIESKIMAVADVIEAMTSHRPYRPSLGLDVALEEIESNSGILYDRKVAQVALDLFRKNNYSITDEIKEITFAI